MASTKFIEKELQTELRRREMILGRVVTSLPNNSGTVTFADYAARMPYVIMSTNAIEPKQNVALSYGEYGIVGRETTLLGGTTDVGNYNETGANLGFTGADGGAYRATDGGSEVGIRPVPGIKRVVCEYDSTTQYTLRKATVDWSAPSLEALQAFDAFLTATNEVALQWGWTSANTPIDGRQGFITIESDKIDVKQDLFSSPRGRILAANGNMDALGGQVSTFSSKLRDDGGFDCTTEIIGMGTNMFAASGKENVGGVGQVLPRALQQEIKEAREGLVSEVLTTTYTSVTEVAAGGLAGIFGKRERTEEEKEVIQVSLQDHMLNALINLDSIHEWYGIKKNEGNEDSPNIEGSDMELARLVDKGTKRTEEQKKAEERRMNEGLRNFKGRQ